MQTPIAGCAPVAQMDIPRAGFLADLEIIIPRGRHRLRLSREGSRDLAIMGAPRKNNYATQASPLKS